VRISRGSCEAHAAQVLLWAPMVVTKEDLPVIRSSERMTYKRCPKKWYWAWRMGLVPKRITFGALDLGTWVHDAFDGWYGKGLRRTDAPLHQHFSEIAEQAIGIASANGAPDYVLDKAHELAALGQAMTEAYQDHYGQDPDVNVIGAEIPLEFSLADENGLVIAKHLLKPDLVFLDRQGDAWLMEHKTATQIVTEHLTIDDQARPYGAMAERALRKIGLLRKGSRFRGIMYNFLRKAFPDDRLTNDKGQALNKNGTVSKKQPAPLFKRHPVEMTRQAKVVTLQRLQAETILITGLTERLRDGRLQADLLQKTPSKGCPRFCDYFAICQAEDGGADIRQMTRDMYQRRNPYTYDAATTEDVSTFEMG